MFHYSFTDASITFAYFICLLDAIINIQIEIVLCDKSSWNVLILEQEVGQQCDKKV